MITPQRKQALVFFFFMVAVAIGILAWNFWLNRGTVIVKGDYPFSLTLGPIKNVLCQKEKNCRFSLAPKKYSLAAEKKDYFDLETNLTVKRWRTSAKELKFEFKPKIQTLSIFHVPPNLRAAEIFPTLPPPGKVIDFSKIPSGTKRIIQTATGEFALIYVGKEFYFYNGELRAPTLSKIELPPHGEAVSANYGARFFLLGPDKLKDQKLYAIDMEGLMKQADLIKEGGSYFETIVQFQRALVNPQIHLSAKDNYALIQETLPSSEAKFYLVDIAGKTKKRIALPENAQGVRLLTGNRIVYDLLENGRRIVRSRYIKNGEAATEEVALDAIHALGVSLRDNVNDTTVIYVSENPPEGLEKRISIFEAVDLAKENLEALQKPGKPEEKNEKKWYFVEFDFETGAEKLLAVFEHTEKEIFLLSDIAGYGEVLRFTTEKDGVKIYHQLLLAPKG